MSKLLCGTRWRRQCGLILIVFFLGLTGASAHGPAEPAAEPTSRVLVELGTAASETLDASWILQGRLSVSWNPQASPKPEFVLTDLSGFTYAMEFGASVTRNPWAYDGKDIVVYGDWSDGLPTGEDGVERQEFLVAELAPLNAPELEVTGTGHVKSDAYYAKLAQDYAPYRIVTKAVGSSPEDRATLGDWTSVIAWPHIPVSASNLPDGRILTWASNQTTAFPVGPEFTYSVTWDPATGQFTDVPHDSHDMFCGHNVILEDGRVFVNGGRNTVRTTSVFNHQTNTWNQIEPMNNGRWYPSTVYLPTNQVFTAVGRGGGRYPELWTSGQGWRSLTGIDLQGPILSYTGHYEQDWWPLLRVTPTGTIFHSGPTPQMHEFDVTGNGSMTLLGAGITDWYPKHGATVMYDEGLLLVAGGATSGSNQASTNRAKVIDIRGATPQIRDTNWMSYARKFQNGVMLPTGDVLMLGGNTSGIKFNDAGTVLAAEMWNPVTEVWTELADAATPRNYHSVALLLADGRVFSGGGGLCGSCAANHQNAQVFSPPYLFAADGSLAPRPSITLAPSQVTNGATFSIQGTPGMTRFSVIKMSATTHAVNTDQRFLSVPFTETAAGQYDLTAHPNVNVLTPGFYMLFGIGAAGVPSVASVVQVSSTGGANRDPVLVDPGDQLVTVGSAVSLNLSAYDPDGDSIDFSALDLPPGLAIDSATGVIDGTPTTQGTYASSITVTDAPGGTASATVTWTVIGPGGGSGFVLREWWTGIGGTAISELTGNANYPDNPSGSDQRSSFEAPVNWAENYGTRMRGFLYPPVSGDYVFWISSDDNGRLLLSTDETAGNAQEIASVPGWSSSRQWDKYPAQSSSPIALQAGERYYIEALQKEAGGGDNLAVAWEIPGAAREIIDGQFLSPYTDPAANEAPQLTHPSDQYSSVGDNVNLPLSASDANGDALTFAASNLPDGLSITTNGIISGAVNGDGIWQVSVTVSDGNGGEDTQVWNWSVFPTSQSATQYRYARLVAVAERSGKPWTSMAEFNLIAPDGALLNRSSWQVSADSEETQAESGVAENAIDGSASSFWHTEWSTQAGDDNDPPHPHEFIVDLTNGRSIGGFSYLPRPGAGNGTITSYDFYLGNDGANWGSPVASGSLPATDGTKVVTFIINAPTNQPPNVTNPGDQLDGTGDAVNLLVVASDPDGDALTYGATGLPPGLSINSGTGRITGNVNQAGVWSVTVSVDDGRGGADSVGFDWTVTSPISIGAMSALPVAAGVQTSYTASATGGINLRYQWLFGDGTPQTAPSTSPSVAHAFSLPGRYVVTLTVIDDTGAQASLQFVQAVHGALAAGKASASTSVLYDASGATDRIWTASADNDSVSVFDAQTLAKLAEIGVSGSPRTLAMAGDGSVWVTSRHSAQITVIDSVSLSVAQRIDLVPGAQPYGIVIDNTTDRAYVAVQATGRVLVFDTSSRTQVSGVNVGSHPRHLSLSADGGELLVSRFISPPVPNEHTGSPSLQGGGEIVVVNTATLSVADTIVLRQSDRQDAEHSARGIPNYLGAAVIAPDGNSAWVPSKQDNIARGGLRDGRTLTHDSTVRSISSRIDLVVGSEDYPSRVDHDDGGIASAATFGPWGSYLYVALEGSRQVSVVEPYGTGEIARFNVGRAPQGLATSPDGNRLYVQNFLDRTLSVVDISAISLGGSTTTLLDTVSTVASESLSTQVLRGKQIFYDAADSRVALQAYISCASCHNDGEQDGRTWDFTAFGEGLRNTITLRGRGGTEHGPLHWTGNFDEVQDFENQIRGLNAGRGLMADADFHAGTRSDPLGQPKAGLSADLDALAAYVSSLDTFARSPFRTAGGNLSAAAVRGRDAFELHGCADCHGGDGFTDSALGVAHDIGTIDAATGNRAGQPLAGLDTPTLRGVWGTAPYLHDGSAATLADAVFDHDAVALTASELNDVVAYLQQIDGLEPGPIANVPPVLAAVADQTNNVGDAVSLVVTASDANGDTLNFSAVGLPTGLSMGSANGVVAGTVTTPGAFAVTVTVTDGRGGSDSVAFSWAVEEDDPPSGSVTYYFSSTVNGTANGVGFQDEDILAYDVDSDTWSIYLDGSDVGLGGNGVDIDAFTVRDDGSVLLSLAADTSVGSLGVVDDADVLLFVPTSTGPSTSGEFSMYFDLSDLGVSTKTDIDALDELPNGDLLLSIRNNMWVGPDLILDEDVWQLRITSTGEDSSGTLTQYFDGSDVGLSGSNYRDTNALFVDETVSEVWISTRGTTDLNGASGNQRDLFVCEATSLGATTACNWRLEWNGVQQGFGTSIDGFDKQ